MRWLATHSRSCLQGWDLLPPEKQQDQESQAFCSTQNKQVWKLVPGLLSLFGPRGVVLPGQGLSRSLLIQADVQVSQNLGGPLQPLDQIRKELGGMGQAEAKNTRI